MSEMALAAHARHAVSRAATPQRAEDEFAEAYQPLFLDAMRLAYRITGCRATAEDVAAEAMARAFARWKQVRGLTYRDAWVMRVASNLALDTVRRRRPAERAKQALERAHQDHVSCGSAEDLVATRLALVAALRQLPARQRDAIVLYYLGGLSEAEVSSSLGITASSVRTHLQRGLARLRTHLGNEPEEVLGGR